MVEAMYMRSPEYFDPFNQHCIYLSVDKKDFSTVKKLCLVQDFAIAQHKNTCCRHENCMWHVILYSKDETVETFLTKLEYQSLKYQHIDNLFGYYKLFISPSLIERRGQIFENLQNAVEYNQYLGRLLKIVQDNLKNDLFGKHSKL